MVHLLRWIRAFPLEMPSIGKMNLVFKPVKVAKYLKIPKYADREHSVNILVSAHLGSDRLSGC